MRLAGARKLLQPITVACARSDKFTNIYPAIQIKVGLYRMDLLFASATAILRTCKYFKEAFFQSRTKKAFILRRFRWNNLIQNKARTPSPEGHTGRTGIARCLRRRGSLYDCRFLPTEHKNRISDSWFLMFQHFLVKTKNNFSILLSQHKFDLRQQHMPVKSRACREDGPHKRLASPLVRCQSCPTHKPPKKLIRDRNKKNIMQKILASLR